MIVYFLIDKIPDDWEPKTIWYLFGFDLLIEVFIFSTVCLFIRTR